MAEASHSSEIHQQKQVSENVRAPASEATSSSELDADALYAAFESERSSSDDSPDLEAQSQELMELVASTKVEAVLMSFEEALEKVNGAALQAVSLHFNGELTSVRAIDSQDCLF